MSSAVAEPVADVAPAVANEEKSTEVEPVEPQAEASEATPVEEPAQAEETANEAPTKRRSTRISSQPKESAKPKKAPTPKNQKKRTADEAGQENGDKEQNGAHKKTKTVVPDIPSIDIGGTLPELTLKNEKDEDVDVSKLATEKGVVIFLVPKADTPGCTTQACGFRDNYSEITGLGYDVYCLSADTPTAQSKWQTKKSLGYSLLSDPKRVFIAALGAADKNKTKRSHYIFEKGTGKLLDKKNPVKPAESPTLALEFIKGQPGAAANGDAPAADADTNGDVPIGDASAPAAANAATTEEAAAAEPTPMET